MRDNSSFPSPVGAVDGEGGSLHRSNINPKPDQNEKDRKAWTEISAEGPGVSLQQHTEALVWLEKGRRCTGMGGE